MTPEIAAAHLCATLAVLAGVGVVAYLDRRDQAAKGAGCDVRGHTYEPRYNVQPPGNLEVSSRCTRAEAESLVDKLSVRTYVCDVCVRCGSVVRPPTTIG